MTVGQQLQQARTQARVTLKEVAQQTKIQPWVLEALEADQLHTTMSPVYVKSFVTTYAKLLRLEPAALIAQLFPTTPEDEEASHLEKDPIDLSGVWSLLRRLIPAAAGVAVIIMLIRLHPIRWVVSRVTPNVAGVSVMSPNESSAAREALLRLPPGQPLDLTVIAHRNAWVLVNADGKLIAQQQLQSGEQETWRARKRFDLTIGTPANVEVILNGQSISPFVMAHQGRLSITHHGIRPLEETAAPSSRTARSADSTP